MIKHDRLGKESYNNFGSKIIIIKYNNKRDIDIYFPNIIGRLKIDNIVILKQVQLNVLMSQEHGDMGI